ncbi:MAG: DUF2786 domain-containing protein [Actinobacteria bacterium]|nr:DUF2786 domain-containing protein [Actinomycetota bacterium]MCA1721193.1 DUF2786 domain-containing protein [Actinomycetota bacterium]
MSDRLVDRVGKLLAQAEGTDNEHEAAAFVERAQQLATEHAVDLELARARQRERQQRGTAEPLVQEQLQVGDKGRRGNRHRVLLYVVVATVNDVLVNVAQDSTYVLGFGHRTDLEVAERLWTSLAVQMTTTAQRRMDRGEHRAAGVPGQTWRLSFYDGFVEAVGERLRAARERVVAQAVPQPSGSPSAALVLRDKADRVKSFYDSASQARGSWRGAATGRTSSSRAARAAGRTEGQRADLGQPGLRERGRLTG